MNYDTVLVEMLSRIQKLEEEVSILKERVDELEGLGNTNNAAEAVPEAESKQRRITTEDIRNYIDNLKDAARHDGTESLCLKASDIHRALKLKHSYPMVCNAMRQKMGAGDEVVFETPSGYSSTLEIRYGLKDSE